MDTLIAAAGSSDAVFLVALALLFMAVLHAGLCSQLVLTVKVAGTKHAVNHAS